MQNVFLDIMKIPVDDPVAFTFFTGYMAMAAAAVFFFFERSTVADKWKTSLLISGLITGIAAVHYYYMRDYYVSTHETPVALRYIDWTLTVPLMVIEFYLLVRAAGAKTSLLYKLTLNHHGNTISSGFSTCQIVRNNYGSSFKLLLHQVYQFIYFCTRYWVKACGWFVIQHYLRMQYNSAGNTNPFSLTAGKFRGHLINGLA